MHLFLRLEMVVKILAHFGGDVGRMLKGTSSGEAREVP